MDHKWGRNVAAEGLGGLGATLAAYYSEGIRPYWLTNSIGPGNHPYAVFVPADVQAPFEIFEVESANASLHFPYQMHVSPDGPV